MTAQVLPAPSAAPGNPGSVQGPSSGNASSSSHAQASNAAVRLAESKKLQIQEKAAQEVKLAIKPFYQNKDITKEEYKEIVRKAVDKVCHSKSGEVNSTKVANLVKAYVDKYKYSRKGSQKKAPEEPVSTEKNIGWLRSAVKDTVKKSAKCNSTCTLTEKYTTVIEVWFW